MSLNGYTIQYSNYYKNFGIFNTENKIHKIRLSDKKIKIIKKLIYHIERKDNSWDILKKLFKYKIIYKNFPSHSTLKDYYDNQLNKKFIGYRAYLLSVIKFNKRYQCTSSERIKKYSSLVDNLDLFIK